LTKTVTSDPGRRAEPIAIIGIGCAFPKAPDVESFWSNVKGGRDAITDVPESHWRAEDYFDADQGAPDMTYARRGGFLDPVEFPPLDFGISPNNIEATDTTQLLGMVVAREALRDAGYAAIQGRDPGREFDRQRTSVILGVTGALELVIPLGARLGHPLWRKALLESGVDHEATEAIVARIADSYVPWQENSFPGLLGNVAAGRIANRFDLGGTNCVVDAACASSLSAIHMAAMELNAGDADMVISGGLDTFNDIFMYMCFSKTPALSPTGTSRPFSSDGDGTTLGEGLGVVVLKRLSDAERDGDCIYALIRGTGSASDGQGSAIYAPQARGQAKAMRSAYQRSGVTPDTVELLEAHGTGTRVGDATELESSSSVYRESGRRNTPWCALGSVKSNIGHTKAAAGAAGLIKIALALKNKVLPPTINVSKPLPGLTQADSPIYLNTEARPWIPEANHPRRAAVSAFGFGGSNFHCVLEEHEGAKSAPDWNGDVLLFALSAESRDTLRNDLQELPDNAARVGARALSAKLRQSFDVRAKFRLVFVHERGGDALEKRCEKLLHLVDTSGDAEFLHTPDGAAFAQRAEPGKLCALFPGQGSQYVGMLRDLTCQFPEMTNALQAANRVKGETPPGQRLSDRIYPIPVFDDEARDANERTLRDTRTAQPAIGALSLGAWKALRRFGLNFDAAAGHSFGELTALCAVKRITEADFHALAAMRGALMADLDGDRGAMLAVTESVETVQALIDGEQLDLVIANRNAPRQIVLSGAKEAVTAAQKICDSRGIRYRLLPVSAAFHSALVADAQRPFHEVLKGVEFHPASCPVYANTTAEPYPDDVNAAKELLSGQLANPVDFVEEIENLYAAGVRTFVEVGPSNKLTSLVASILDSRPHHAVAIDASRGVRGGEFDLACVIAQLAALGYAVDLQSFDESANRLASETTTTREKLTIPLTGANYMKERATSAEKKTPNAPLQQHATPASESAGPTQDNRPAPEPAPPVVNATRDIASAGGSLEALQLTQENILALQRLQQQTAELHRQYLESQDSAQRNIERLLDQQARLFGLATADAMAPPLPPAAEFVPLPAVPPTAAPVTAPPIDAAREIEPSKTPPAVEPVTPEATISEALLAVVVEKTGYPADMLSLEMNLDTDLGVDSIKRVEILSALGDALPGVSEINPEDIGKFRTLADVVGFLAQTSMEENAASDLETVGETHPDASRVLEIVAEKTGYPRDMLSLDMNLDTDLGIDSIKRVEILSAIQERLPNAPEVQPDQLARFRTLADVAAFLGNESAEIPPLPATDEEVPMAAASEDLLIGIVADKTGYPRDMLSLDMSLDADLGIDSIKRVEILSTLQEHLPDAAEIEASELGRLRTLRDVHERLVPAAKDAANVGGDSAAENHPAPTELASSVRLERRVLVATPRGNDENRKLLNFPADAELWISDDGMGIAQQICTELAAHSLPARVVPLHCESVPANVAGVVIVSPQNPHAGFIGDAFRLIRAAGPALREAARRGDALIAGLVRVNGAFGLNGGAIEQPLTAGLAGLVKTAAKEWPMVTSKVIDFAAGAVDACGRIARELRYHGPLEVGVAVDGDVVLSLHDAPLDDTPRTGPFDPDDLVVVSGGARGITAEIAVSLAETCQAALLLLGRSTAANDEPEWTVRLSDARGIRRALAEHADGESRTPAALDRELKRILAGREINRTLERIRNAGAQAMYRAVDIRNGEQVAQAVAEARRRFGPVRGLIHGAGVLADRLIDDKTDAQFESVFTTKVEGFDRLLDAVGDQPLKVISLFSSSTARFGRKGQADYAAANEVLNKRAQLEARRRQGCRVVSINWGPWDGGMVGADLKKLFAAEGVGAIPLAAGAALHLKEIASPSGSAVEVVVSATPTATPENATTSSAAADTNTF
jgi:acyl transferase domain-containing protein/NAD(P)-dependent dehydrogenase (short-subunit alcohol dehydrogenase family)